MKKLILWGFILLDLAAVGYVSKPTSAWGTTTSGRPGRRPTLTFTTTATNTWTGTNTFTVTNTPTNTLTFTPTFTPTFTQTISLTNTANLGIKTNNSVVALVSYINTFVIPTITATVSPVPTTAAGL